MMDPFDLPGASYVPSPRPPVRNVISGKTGQFLGMNSDGLAEVMYDGENWLTPVRPDVLEPAGVRDGRA